MITREEVTEKILQAKKDRGLTFEDIAHAVGRHTVWTTAALLGQATMSKRGSTEGYCLSRTRSNLRGVPANDSD